MNLLQNGFGMQWPIFHYSDPPHKPIIILEISQFSFMNLLQGTQTGAHMTGGASDRYTDRGTHVIKKELAEGQL